MFAVLAVAGCKANSSLTDASALDAPVAPAGSCVTPLFTVSFPDTVTAIDRHVSNRSASCVGVTGGGAFFGAVSVPMPPDQAWLNYFESALREEELRLGTPVVSRVNRVFDGASGMLLQAEAGSRIRLAVILADARLYVLYVGFTDLSADAALEATAFIDSFRRTARQSGSPLLARTVPPLPVASACQLDEAAARTCERDRVSPGLCAGAAELQELTAGFCRHLALILAQAECRRGGCPIGDVCSSGICCPLGTSRCGSACVDPRKCQSCDQTAGVVVQGCADQSRCDQCEPGRVPGEPGNCKGCSAPHGDACCAGQCTSIYTDDNCGACGNACYNGFRCNGSECLCGDARTCPPGTRCLEERCVP